MSTGHRGWRIDQRLKRRRQIRLVRNRALTSPTGPADPAGNLAPRRAKLSDAAIDRTAGQPSRLGGRRDTTIVPPQRFVGSEQTPATLIKMHRYVLPAHPNIVDVDHPPRIAFRARVAPSAFAILFLRSSLALDSLVSRRALNPFQSRRTGARNGEFTL